MKKLIAAMIVVFILANAGFGVYLEPLLYTLTPLQRFYLRPYLLSSLKAGDRTATTEVRWLWKVRPEAKTSGKHGGRKTLPPLLYAFATEGDVVPVPARQRLWKDEQIPFMMSSEALHEGWSGVVWRNPVEVNSGQLAIWLRQYFYDGEPVWGFFLQPFLILALGLLLVWVVTRDRAAYYRKNPVWSVPYWRHLERQMLERGRQFRKRQEARRTPPALPPVQPVRVMRAAPAKPLPPLVETESEAIASSAPAKPSVQPALWDESKGLE